MSENTAGGFLSHGPYEQKPESESTITITKNEHDRLVERDEWLSDLEQAGVDNWQGYDEACDIRRERKKE